MPRLVAERADVLPALAEVFREHGFEGASLTLISKATGLGKGSLYHFFPGGKEQMAAAVLAEIDGWFEHAVFLPLVEAGDLAKAIDAMFASVTAYFRSGQRVCLVGALGLSESRHRFAQALKAYFARWIAVLREALAEGGVAAPVAQHLAEETVAGIQGAIVLARALDEPAVFERVTRQLRERLSRALRRNAPS